ncbi:MAG: putative transposase [Eubacteriales bacterium]|nr:putative transposase [Eubacteriales bacterium]MDN5364076.1 putative transposase [Eubacteriales bacterium]
MALPEPVRRRLRTTNAIERLNGEIRRRERVVGIFPNEEAALRVIAIEPRKRQPKKALITLESYQRDFTHKIGLDLKGAICGTALGEICMLAADAI